MPFNEKKEWVNPETKDYVSGSSEQPVVSRQMTEKDMKRGYSICFCGAYKLLEAGFDCEMFLCKRCNEYAAAPFEIFDSEKQKLGEEFLAKLIRKLTGSNAVNVCLRMMGGRYLYVELTRLGLMVLNYIKLPPMKFGLISTPKK